MSAPKTIIPVGFAQITHIFGGGALPTGAACTYGVSNVNEATPSVLAEAYHGLFGDEVMGSLSASVTLLTTECKLGPNDTGAFAEFSDPVIGGAEGPCSPPNVTFLIKKNTLLGGRRGRGRMYLPGVDETLVNSAGEIDEAHVTASQANLDAWYDGMTGGPETPVLLHRDDVDEDGEAIPNTAPAPTVITGFVWDVFAATQRRRLRR